MAADQLPLYSVDLGRGERSLSPEEQHKHVKNLERRERKRQEVLFVEHKLESAMKSFGW